MGRLRSNRFDAPTYSDAIIQAACLIEQGAEESTAVQLRLGLWPYQHSATNETVSPVRNVIVEVMLQPLSMASRHASLLQ